MVWPILQANVNEGRTVNEWLIRCHLQPGELGEWIDKCRDAYIDSFEKVMKADTGNYEETKELGMWIFENRNYDVSLTYSILRLKPNLFISGILEDEDADSVGQDADENTNDREDTQN